MSEYHSRLSDPKQRRELLAEETILNVTEHLCQLMELHEMSRSQLARELGVSRGRVTQLLDGANLTLRTVGKMLAVFDRVLPVGSRPADGFGDGITEIDQYLTSFTQGQIWDDQQLLANELSRSMPGFSGDGLPSRSSSRCWEDTTNTPESFQFAA